MAGEVVPDQLTPAPTCTRLLPLAIAEPVTLGLGSYDQHDNTENERL